MPLDSRRDRIDRIIDSNIDRDRLRRPTVAVTADPGPKVRS